MNQLKLVLLSAFLVVCTSKYLLLKIKDQNNLKSDLKNLEQMKEKLQSKHNLKGTDYQGIIL